MDSNWLRIGDPLPRDPGKEAGIAYPVIVIWTDANAQVPGFSYSLQNASYPPASKMPRNYADLLQKWQDPTIIDQDKKLFAMFIAPFAQTSAWDPMMQWDGHINAGTLDNGNNQMASKIADAISTIDDIGLTARPTK